MPTNEMLQAVLDYASRGWPVFPCCWPDESGACGCKRGHKDRDIGKAPLSLHGLSDAITDADAIRAWWQTWPNANIGVRCGVESGIVVIDVDPRHGGEETLAELETQNGKFPDTVESQTGGGGRHLLYRHPGPGSYIKNDALGKTLGPGLDIRGDGGFIVAPPSLHVSGQRYVWELSSDPADTPLASLPHWLRYRLENPTEGTFKPAEPLPDRIGEGERNAQLASLAGSMRRRGASEAAILAALKVENAERCEPPLPDEDLEKIARSVGRYAPAEPDPRLVIGGKDGEEDGSRNLTDMGNGERLVLQYGADLRYSYATGQWLWWTGQRWKWDDTGEIERRAKLTVRTIYGEAADEGDDKHRKEIAGHAKRSESERALRAMLFASRSDPAVSVSLDRLDSNPWLFNCLNGTIDLQTGELHEHQKRDLITKLSPVEFDPVATCPVFDGFIAQIMQDNPELITFVQRMLGYGLTGSISEQALFILYGLGANGKSTLLDVVLDILGDYAKHAAPDILLTKKGDNHPTGVADLAGARLVTSIEIDEGKRLAESLVKQMTGGDRVKARRMRQDYFEFKPEFKLFLATNHKPLIKGTDKAIWRRIKLVPFAVSISEAEQDRKLPEKLRREHSGILRWLVEGCLEWQRTGLGIPSEVSSATESYRMDMDTLAAFLADRCEIGAREWITAKALYGAYCQWCEDSKEKPETQRTFGMRLVERGFTKQHTKTGWVYFGVGLMPLVTLVTHSDPNFGIDSSLNSHDGVIPKNGSQGSQGSQGEMHILESSQTDGETSKPRKRFVIQ